jgi:hypothetical protein
VAQRVGAFEYQTISGQWGVFGDPRALTSSTGI